MARDPDSLRTNLTTLSAMQIVKKFGGLNSGHFVFQTGEHGNGFISKMTFLRYPAIVEELGNRLADQYVEDWGRIDVVVGPSMVGAILACAVAKRIGVPFTIVYRSKAGPIKFHRDFMPTANAGCLFADDLAFTGASLSEYASFMSKCGLNLIGASVVCARRELENFRPIHIRSLFVSPFVRTTAENCRLCQEGVAIMQSDVRE